jgi:hypothetical protein
MTKIIKLTESDLIRLVKRVIKEQTTNTKYMVTSSKFSMFGSTRIDIRIVDKVTGTVLFSMGVDGTNPNQVYNDVIKKTQDELVRRKIIGIVLPTLGQIKETK